jgi:signal transduction histidine kinase
MHMTKILVIEDETDILDNLVEALRIEGFDAYGAANGVAGIELTSTYHPDLVICDIMMPQMNGYDVLLKLRDDPATFQIPFIFLTARTERGEIRRGMELGADDYVTKPFTIPEILAAIQVRLRRQATVSETYQRKLEDLRNSIILALPHELRTPLTAVIGYSEIILMDAGGFSHEEIVNMVSSINHSGQRLQHLVENHLIYAQLELMKAGGSPGNLRLGNEIISAYETVTLCAQAAAAFADREQDTYLTIADVSLTMASDHLRKIIWELLNNAFKFSEPGSPVYLNGTAADGLFTLTIQDSGRGMSPEEVANIGAYMQFQRRIYEQQGIGLGLIIAKRLAELYGGCLNITSESEVGTIVQVSLPCA